LYRTNGKAGALIIGGFSNEKSCPYMQVNLSKTEIRKSFYDIFNKIIRVSLY